MIPHDLTKQHLRRVFWPKVVLIGSLRFYDDMLRLYEEFGKERINALVPWPLLMNQDDLEYDEQRIPHAIGDPFNTETHLLRIASADIAYVVNPNGYVGLNSGIDIGYAAGKQKTLYSMMPIADIGANELIDEVKTPQEIIVMGKKLIKSYKLRERQYLKACRTASTH